MASPSTGSMTLPHHRELVLKVVRQIDQDITDVTGDLRWNKIRVHTVKLS